MALRVAIVEDNLLVRIGLTSVLAEIGLEVIAAYADAPSFESELGSVIANADLAVLDVRLPPTNTTEGIQLATALRRKRPGFPVVLVSHYVETAQLTALLESSAGGVGYLLKDRVLDLDTIATTLVAVADGEVRLDPIIVSALMGRQRADDPVGQLTPREHEVLALMAEGLNNQAIARELTVNVRTVETHVAAVFTRLGLGQHDDTHRRVRAVVTYLRSR